MEDLDKEFDKWFEDTWVAGSTGYIDIHRDEINDMKKDISNFIRQREKDLLEDIKEKVLQSLMWSDKHGKEEQFSALANYLDSKLKELSND